MAEKEIEVEEDPSFYFRQESRKLPVTGTVGVHVRSETGNEK